MACHNRECMGQATGSMDYMWLILIMSVYYNSLYIYIYIYMYIYIYIKTHGSELRGQVK